MYYSHKNYLLKDHLTEVCENSTIVFDNKLINYNIWDIEFSIIRDFVRATALLHDCGKYSQYFQIHLREAENFDLNYIKSLPKDTINKYKKNSSLSYHALLSGIILYAFLHKLSSKYIIKDERKKLLIYSCVSAVIEHHTNLKNRDFIKDYKLNTVQNLKEMIDKTDFSELYEILNNYFGKLFTDSTDFKNVVNNYIEDFVDKIKIINNISEGLDLFSILTSVKKNKIDDLCEFDNLPKEYDFYLLIFIYSIIIYSDKYHAILKEVMKKKHEFEDKTKFVDNYKLTKGFKVDTELNKQRAEAHKNAISKLNKIDIKKDKLYTLNLNTGYGKTLTSLDFAFKLQKKLWDEYGVKFKIIYCMPFTSIIEQNFEVIKEVLEINIGKNKVTQDKLLKHHYLSNKNYKTEKNEYDKDKSRFLVETWDSEIIFTTFVQFFETIIGNRNRMFVKFPNMVNSIVIFDEIQALNPELYYIFGNQANALADIFNIYMINCSATQPDFKNSFKTSLLDNYRDYYKTDRTQMIFPKDFFNKNSYNAVKIKNIKNFFNFIDVVVEKEKVIGNKNMMIVLNTKKNVLNTYNFIKDKYKKSDVFLLSNSLIPLHKNKKIKEIEGIMKNKNVMLISTQLIEAGIDFDFDLGIRDFAPLPSLIQCCGRINRNFKYNKNYGKMYICNIGSNCNRVYDKSLLEYTFEALRKICIKSPNKNILLEEQYIDTNDEYFKYVDSFYRKDRELYEKLVNMNFKDINFQLIEEKYDSVCVFIEFDDKAEKLWEQFKSLPFNPIERKKEFEKISFEFGQYVINESRENIENLLLKYTSKIEEVNGFIRVAKELCCNKRDELDDKHIYSYETGLNITNEYVDNIFI